MMGNPPSLLWDEEALQRILQRQVDLMRASGALARLPLTGVDHGHRGCLAR